MVSIAWAKISGEVVQNSFYAAGILWKPGITVGEMFDEENNVMDVSFFSTILFFGSDEENTESCGTDDYDEAL